MKKITLLFLFVLVGMQAFAQPSTITITAPTDATSVRITGPWWGWNPTGGPIATQNTDGTWLISLDAGASAMEYLIVVDDVQENLIDNAQGSECTARVDAGNIVTDYSSYANRKWLPTDGVDYSETYDDCSQMVFPESCSDGIQNQDETGIDCGGSTCAPCDLAAPTAFTAIAGVVGGFSVELLLTATDDSGSVTYDVTYGSETAQTTGVSGVETALTIGGLTPETAYTFEVSATDASGNAATNNSISVSATTTEDTSTACSGFTSEVSPDSSSNYSVGINYDFQTVGADVMVTFEFLDTDKSGFNPQLFFAPSTYVNMDGSAAPTYTATLSGYAVGETISFTFRGAFAGGLVNSKVFDYVVGDDCSTASNVDNNTLNVNLYPSPAQNELTISAENTIQNASIYNVLGRKVQSYTVNARSKKLDISALSTGIYILKYTANNAVGSMKFVKE